MLALALPISSRALPFSSCALTLPPLPCPLALPDVSIVDAATIGSECRTPSTLSEKITRVLPRLKCPYNLEPHQIQGSNFVAIFPVMQWLVKKVLETREELSDYIRNFSESQFSKTRVTPTDLQFQQTLKVKKKPAHLNELTPDARVFVPAPILTTGRLGRLHTVVVPVPRRRARALQAEAPVPQPAGRCEHALRAAGASPWPGRAQAH